MNHKHDRNLLGANDMHGWPYSRDRGSQYLDFCFYRLIDL